MLRIVFDTETNKVGCPIIQAQYDTINTFNLVLFPPETWFITPTDTMGVYEVTVEQLETLVDIAVFAATTKGIK